MVQVMASYVRCRTRSARYRRCATTLRNKLYKHHLLACDIVSPGTLLAGEQRATFLLADVHDRPARRAEAPGALELELRAARERVLTLHEELGGRRRAQRASAAAEEKQEGDDKADNCERGDDAARDRACVTAAARRGARAACCSAVRRGVGAAGGGGLRGIEPIRYSNYLANRVGRRDEHETTCGGERLRVEADGYLLRLRLAVRLGGDKCRCGLGRVAITALWGAGGGPGGCRCGPCGPPGCIASVCCSRSGLRCH